MSDSVLGPPQGGFGLRIRGGIRDGQVIYLHTSKCTLGASKECSLQLQQSGIQPVHCFILRGRGGTVIRRWAPDTRLNGELFDDAFLQNGDRLSIGPIDFEILFDTEAFSRSLESTPSSQSASQAVSLSRDRILVDLEPKPLESEQSEQRQQRFASRQIGHRRARRLIGLLREAHEEKGKITEHYEQALQAGRESLDQKELAHQKQIESQKSDLEEREKKLAERELRIQQRDIELDEQADALDYKERAVAESDQILHVRASQLETEAEQQTHEREEQRKHFDQQREQLAEQQEEHQRALQELQEQRLLVEQEYEALEQGRQELHQDRALLESERAEFQHTQSLLANQRDTTPDLQDSTDPTEQNSENLPLKENETSNPVSTEPTAQREIEERESKAIAFEPASVESPLSSVELFDRLGLPVPEDDSPGDTDALPSLPQDSSPSPSSYASGDPSSSAEEGEESIEAYMARLMVRVRGEVEEAEISAGMVPPSVMLARPQYTPPSQTYDYPEESHPAQTEASPEKAESVEKLQAELSEEIAITKDDSGLLMPQRDKTEEKGPDLAAMRDLANASAKSHLTQSTKTVWGQASLNKLAMSLLALVAGISLTLWTTEIISFQFLGACFAFGVATYWLLESALLANNLLTMASENEEVSADTEALDHERSEETEVAHQQAEEA